MSSIICYSSYVECDSNDSDIVGFQYCCGEAVTAFHLLLRHKLSQGVLVRGSVTRRFAAHVCAAPILGDLREKDFHLSGGHSGLHGGRSRRRAFGYPGPGQATSRTERGDDQASRRYRKAAEGS